MVTPLPVRPPLCSRAHPRRARRLRTSMLAAGAQIGLALVVALGSIGLASVAALLAPAGPSPEQVVEATVTRSGGTTATAPSAAARANAGGAASPPATPHR